MQNERAQDNRSQFKKEFQPLLNLLLLSSLSVSSTKNRSSRPDVFCKKGVFKNFAKFTEKHLCQGLYFNKVAGLMSAILLKQRLWHRCFLVNFAKFQREILQNTSGGCFCKKPSPDLCQFSVLHTSHRVHFIFALFFCDPIP